MMMQRVYLDHAASTPMAPEVLEAMLPYLSGHFGNASSIHHYGRTLRNAIEKSRRTVAGLVGCSPAEIVFTSGGTEADNIAIKCSVQAGMRRIITSPLEHHAVLHATETVRKVFGVEVHLLTPDEKGQLDLAELESLLKDQPPALVSLMHVNNELGNTLDVHATGEICAAHGAVFHSDTVQSLGILQPNWACTPVHYAVGAAHKFNGPAGIGFLYIKSGHALPAFICGGGQERNQRAGTENVSGIVGLAAALDYTYNHLETKREHLIRLKTRLWELLQQNFAGVQTNGDPATAQPTVLNVAFPNPDKDGMLLMNLDIRGVAASGGSACSSGASVGSHVLKALGHPAERISGSIRFSFGESNTLQELDYVTEALRQALPVEATARR